MLPFSSLVLPLVDVAAAAATLQQQLLLLLHRLQPVDVAVVLDDAVAVAIAVAITIAVVLVFVLVLGNSKPAHTLNGRI